MNSRVCHKVDATEDRILAAIVNRVALYADCGASFVPICHDDAAGVFPPCPSCHREAARARTTYPRQSQPHYVYRCYDAEDRLIYVGCTVDPATRIANHRAAAWWGTQIVRVRHTVFPDREHALRMERTAIGEEQPRWNLRSRWHTRSIWSAEHYVDYYIALKSQATQSTRTLDHMARVVDEARRRYGIDVEETAA